MCADRDEKKKEKNVPVIERIQNTQNSWKIDCDLKMRQREHLLLNKGIKIGAQFSQISVHVSQ